MIPKFILSSFSTYYGSSSDGRKANIKLGSSLLNNITLKNGEIFDFYKYVGLPTIKRGFKNAPILANGEIAEGVGGGLCQLATTLYNAALLAGLKIIERHNHSSILAYIPPGLDAAVSYGYLNLKFKNTTGGNIFTKSTYDGSTVTFTIYGDVKENSKVSVYTVTISNTIFDTYRTYYKDNIKIKTEYMGRSVYRRTL
jgi:vancomycin resistance protein YoaR